MSNAWLNFLQMIKVPINKRAIAWYYRISLIKLASKLNRMGIVWFYNITAENTIKALLHAVLIPEIICKELS